jgi:hypothetical protein
MLAPRKECQVLEGVSVFNTPDRLDDELTANSIPTTFLFKMLVTLPA